MVILAQLSTFDISTSQMIHILGLTYYSLTYPLVICYIAIENGGSFHSYGTVYQRVYWHIILFIQKRERERKQFLQDIGIAQQWTPNQTLQPPCQHSTSEKKQLYCHIIPSGNLWHSYGKWPIEIVSFPSYKMVDRSSSLCKRLPEGNSH